MASVTAYIEEKDLAATVRQEGRTVGGRPRVFLAGRPGLRCPSPLCVVPPSLQPAPHARSVCTHQCGAKEGLGCGGRDGGGIEGGGERGESGEGLGAGGGGGLGRLARSSMGRYDTIVICILTICPGVNRVIQPSSL